MRFKGHFKRFTKNHVNVIFYNIKRGTQCGTMVYATKVAKTK